jgi:hypothetical protein
MACGLGVTAAAVLAGGCHNANHDEAGGNMSQMGHVMNHGAAATTQQADAVTCAKCQVTWVKQPITTGGGKERVIAYQTRKSMECPDCRTAVDNFFRTGRLEHSCKTCGDQLQACEAH